jgi:HTH-type transcriptional regulator/antitoxin HigA
MEIKPIREEADDDRALRRVEELWNSPKDSAETDERDLLVTLIQAYERDHYPIGLPDPIAAIKFRLEQDGKDLRSLVGVIGGRTRVYEVMRGDRPLSLNMIRNLHHKLNIPTDVLIQPLRQRAKKNARRSRAATQKYGRSPRMRKSA